MAQLIKLEVSDILCNRLSDPRIGLVTVTDVEMTKDLRHAKIFFSVYGDKETQERTLEALDHATNFIRGELAPRIRLKFMPEIHFQFDPSVERADRIARLLDDLRSKEPNA